MPRAIVFYDGICNLCDRFVAFIAARDRTCYFQFAPLQGQTARQVLPLALREQKPQTVILYEEGRFWTASDAVIRILRRLGGGWRFLTLVAFLPQTLRDGLYQAVAKSRYFWFGRRTSCRLPQPQDRWRFLA